MTVPVKKKKQRTTNRSRASRRSRSRSRPRVATKVSTLSKTEMEFDSNRTEVASAPPRTLFNRTVKLTDANHTVSLPLVMLCVSLTVNVLVLVPVCTVAIGFRHSAAAVRAFGPANHALGILSCIYLAILLLSAAMLVALARGRHDIALVGSLPLLLRQYLIFIFVQPFLCHFSFIPLAFALAVALAFRFSIYFAKSWLTSSHIVSFSFSRSASRLQASHSRSGWL